ncbi:hypothetical protein [uncultured Rhodospira sp.]|nr:hypothetical protein [uncultured Rhodospira sp.]
MVMPDKAASPPAATDPEMSDRPKRRTFTAQDKLRIQEEAATWPRAATRA